MKKTTGKAKKGLVMLLCASMVISVTPMSAMAGEMTTEEVLTSESAGTEETDAEESFISEELTTEEEETGEQGNEEGIQFEDGDTEETWITEEADTDQLAEAELFIGESDIDLYEMTDGMASEDGESVYELTEKDGAYYDTQGIKYTLSTDGNTATVSGYGSNIASEITIPAKVKLGETVYTVTTIGDRAFDTCTNLTKVNFTSDSLTTIEDYVFRKTNLESIKIPKNVTSIGEAICAQCTQLTSIKVDSENKVFNTGLEENVNCIVSGNTLLQGCSTSKVPGTVTEIGRHAFTRMDIRNVNFSDCSKLYISEAGFSLSTMPEDWKIPESFWVIQCLYGITTLKKVTLHDDLFLQPCTSFNSIFPGCSNIEKAVIPASIGYDSGWTNNIDMFGDGGAAENLTVYVGDFTDDNALYQSLKAHAYEDYTGNEVVKYDKDKTRHYILKKAYKVQFDKEYAGYTLAKAKGHTESWVEYYSNVKERLIPAQAGASFGYHMRDEDFYIYITSHAYKHYAGSGTGVRTLLDFYAYLHAKEETLDFSYIEQECKKLGITAFEKQNRSLCKKVFTPQHRYDRASFEQSLSQDELDMLKYYLSSGVYGTFDRMVANRMEKQKKADGKLSKFTYYWQRVFPGMELYERYPILVKHKWLIPGHWFYRIVRLIFSRKRRENIMREVKAVKRAVEKKAANE